MENEKPLVESFTLDHTIVKAPYVRLISIDEGPIGDKISNFDFRLTQPNKEYLTNEGAHSLEHSMAYLFRKVSNLKLIDVSPFGCFTGFHMIFWGEVTVSELKEELTKVLEQLLQLTEVYGASEKECGNYRSHSLDTAKTYARKILEEGISTDPYTYKD